jgi:hypothetical protein
VSLRQTDIEHFKRGKHENPRFWSRFGEAPKLKEVTVLKIGSGWGSLSVDTALVGAERELPGSLSQLTESISITLESLSVF